MWNLSSKIPYLFCYLFLLTYNNPQRNRLPNYPDKEMPNSKKRIAETISVTQLLRIFPDNESCVKWMEKMRWNGKPTCAHCGGTEQVSDPPSKPNAYWCGNCRLHFSVTTGTILHATKTPLRNWIVAIYSVITAKNGVSSMQLSKEIGVQYRTAWYMLYRIREACAKDEFKL